MPASSALPLFEWCCPENAPPLPSSLRKINKIINVDALTRSASEQTLDACDDDRHIFVQADIRDPSFMESVFRKYDPDAVMHLAAESHVDHSINRPLDFIETNVVGTCHLLRCGAAPLGAEGPSRYIPVSSCFNG